MVDSQEMAQASAKEAAKEAESLFAKTTDGYGEIEKERGGKIIPLSYKGASITIDKPGTYQLVDNDPSLESTSYIFIETEKIEGEVYLILPNSEETYKGNNASGLIYITLNGNLVYKNYVIPSKPDTINGRSQTITLSSSYSTTSFNLFYKNRWLAQFFLSK